MSMKDVVFDDEELAATARARWERSEEVSKAGRWTWAVGRVGVLADLWMLVSLPLTTTAVEAAVGRSWMVAQKYQRWQQVREV